MSAPRGLIGVIHLPAMPGDPGHAGGGFEAVYAHAMRDADALAEGGVEHVVVENFGSRPFVKGDARDPLPPHQVAAITVVARALRDRFARVGVNCLRNDVVAALGIAAATGASFVRVNVHVGAYVTDQGVIEGEAARSLRYRHALGAHDVAICADVLVKHATPLAPIDATQATKDTLDRGMADAVVVTGTATGAPVDLATLEKVREAAGTRAVLLGSGLTPDDAERLLRYADGAIVGTWVKAGGDVRAAVDASRVRALVQACAGRFRDA
ncbi:BtpA/SgcQ family protein [Sandaracinus amylolyticus]|uniref:Photosystem I assembly-like protein n=1 Tax=Sandaracinus amylolyticus TaxID=927083 RepID=A0A0F6W4J2_9BACT|nr:BtpA/SgcQ family protein [Sandaracinus amylolyticus]AKF07236.1 photosystem I assembly-like protein [Sandaracinus amylolyticus]